MCGGGGFPFGDVRRRKANTELNSLFFVNRGCAAHKLLNPALRFAAYLPTYLPPLAALRFTPEVSEALNSGNVRKKKQPFRIPV